jgi:hypothetical protein
VLQAAVMDVNGPGKGSWPFMLQHVKLGCYKSVAGVDGVDVLALLGDLMMVMTIIIKLPN